MRSVLAVACTIVVSSSTSVAVHGQQSASRPTGEVAVLEELAQIRKLLQTLVSRTPAPAIQRPANPPAGDPVVTLSRVTGPALGHDEAPITIVEFTDLQCPFCSQFHNSTFLQLKREYIDTGKVRFVTRDFPLERLHPLATTAARASRCAGEQGRFWEMRQAILRSNAQLTRKTFSDLARALQLHLPAFDRCTDDPSRFAEAIQADARDGASIGVSATPSFVVGRVRQGALEGVRLTGARPFPAFDTRLKELMMTITPEKL